MVHHGEIRWCSFPPPDKRRPVLVLTRDPGIRQLNTVTVASITSTRRSTRAHVLLGADDGLRQPSAVNLDLIPTVRQTAIGRLIAQLPEERMREVYAAIQFALGFELIKE